MTSRLPLLALRGEPRAIGEAHGRSAAPLVAHNLAVYFRRFAEEGEMTRGEVLRRVAHHWPGVREASPEFAAMAEGIAAGAGQPLPEVAALNLRFELLYGEFSRIGRAALGGAPLPAGDCTAFAVLPEVTADGHLYIAQNWDWIPDVAGLLLRVTRPDGLRVLCFTEAGIAGGKIGMNSAGLGLAINGLLSSEDDWSRLGRPFHARTWEILCSTTLEAAADAATDGVRGCSANFLIGQAGPQGKGTAVDLEVAPRGVGRYDPESGMLVHTNHFRDPDRLGIWQPLVEERRSTYHRCARAEHLLDRARGRLTTEALRSVLRDHLEHPESVCRHPNPALPDAERYQTVFSVVMDLHAGRLHAASGPPCTHAYAEYAL